MKFDLNFFTGIGITLYSLWFIGKNIFSLLKNISNSHHVQSSEPNYVNLGYLSKVPLGLFGLAFGTWSILASLYDDVEEWIGYLILIGLVVWPFFVLPGILFTPPRKPGTREKLYGDNLPIDVLKTRWETIKSRFIKDYYWGLGLSVLIAIPSRPTLKGFLIGTPIFLFCIIPWVAIASVSRRINTSYIRGEF